MRLFINQQLYPGDFLLHKKYAKSEMLLELVWTHSNIVAEIALQLVESGKFDTTELPREFVLQAGLLFEVGAYICDGFEWMPGQEPTGRPYIQHGIMGAWILEQEGYSPQIIQAAHSHTGVGLTAADVRNFGLQLPEADYLPFTPLQLLLTYATKFHSKAPKFKTRDDIIESLKKYGPEKIHRFEELEAQFGQPDLTKIQEKYAQWHQGFQFQIQQLQSGESALQTAESLLNSAGVAAVSETPATTDSTIEITPLPTGAATPGMLHTEASAAPADQETKTPQTDPAPLVTQTGSQP